MEKITGNVRGEVRFDPEARIHVLSARVGCYRAKLYCLDRKSDEPVETFLVTPPLDMVEAHGYEGEETLVEVLRVAIETAVVDSIELVVERHENGDLIFSEPNAEPAVARSSRTKPSRVSRRAGVYR